MLVVTVEVEDLEAAKAGLLPMVPAGPARDILASLHQTEHGLEVKVHGVLVGLQVLAGPNG